MRSMFAPLVSLLLAFTFAQPVHAARLALVIGNDAYRNLGPAGILTNAGNDARLMAATLSSAGFEVVGGVRTNLDRNGLWDALERFKARVGKQDEVVFYYSGHGVQVDATQLLLPVDINNQSEDQVGRDAVPLHRVQESLRDARFALVVIDACRDNPFPPKPGMRSIGQSRGLQPPARAVEGSVVVMAAANGERALDYVPGATTGNGLFTHELVRALKTPGLDVLSAVRKTRAQVLAAARTVNHAQKPTYVDELAEGDFVMFPSVQIGGSWSTTVVQPVAQSTPQTQSVLPTAPSPGQTIRDCANCPELVVIPEGSFRMSSDYGDRFEMLSRNVNIKGFALGKTEVTQGQWKAVMGGNPSHFTDCGDNCPVEQVSWDDVQQYIQQLNAKTGKSYRLPSEVEWEYACRAGGRHRYCGGNDLNAVGWYGAFVGSAGNSSATTNRVAGKQANAWGLYDMSGNVWEWTQDCRNQNYEGAPSDGSAWTTGNCRRRVLRGGSWDAPSLSFERRSDFEISTRSISNGFRLARSLP